MKSFRSPEEMLDAHELMFGTAGRQCAEVVLKWAITLFAVPLDALNIRVVLAPVELGPYNRHAGYHYGPEGSGAFILGNRHIVQFKDGTLVLKRDQIAGWMGSRTSSSMSSRTTPGPAIARASRVEEKAWRAPRSCLVQRRRRGRP